MFQRAKDLRRGDWVYLSGRKVLVCDVEPRGAGGVQISFLGHSTQIVRADLRFDARKPGPCDPVRLAA